MHVLSTLGAHNLPTSSSARYPLQVKHSLTFSLRAHRPYENILHGQQTVADNEHTYGSTVVGHAHCAAEAKQCSKASVASMPQLKLTTR